MTIQLSPRRRTLEDYIKESPVLPGRTCQSCRTMPRVRRVLEHETLIVEHLSFGNSFEVGEIRVHRGRAFSAQHQRRASPCGIPIRARIEVKDVRADLFRRVEMWRNFRA